MSEFGGNHAPDVPDAEDKSPGLVARAILRLRELLRGNEYIALIVFALLVSVVAFSWPWLPSGGPADELERYLPQRDGSSEYTVSFRPEGKILYYESRNIELIPDLRAMNDLPLSQAQAIQEPYLEDGEDALPIEELASRLARVEVYRQNIRRLYPNGETYVLQNILVRDETGEYVIGTYEPGTEKIGVFSPRLQLLPADLGPDAGEWSSSGEIGNATYRSTGRVFGSGPVDAALGDSDDCVRVETTLDVLRNGESVGASIFRDAYCAGTGLVSSREISDSDPPRREVVYSSDGSLAADADLPDSPSPPDSGPETTSPDGNWNLRRFALTRPETDAPAEGTFAPVYVSDDEPTLLAASIEGDLLAFDPSGSGEEPLWTFHPSGSIYGRPTLDSETGHIFFGTTDRRIYALDARGLYLWDFEVGDSVATSPLVAEGVVISGSDDGSVYGLDAETGEELWSYETGGPVASSPAFAGGVAVIGSDDGAVYGLDPETGELVWMQNAGGPVEAGIAADSDTVYVASRDGRLYAFDGETGEPLWDTDSGYAMETKPVIGGDAVYAVTGAGELVAFDRESGHRLWVEGKNSYVGSPEMAGDSIVVAGKDGDVYAYDPSGEQIDVWSHPDSEDGTAATHSFRYGPSAGGDAVWLVDVSGYVSRFGPSADGEEKP